jgi:hypothetical protein
MTQEMTPQSLRPRRRTRLLALTLVCVVAFGIAFAVESALRGPEKPTTAYKVVQDAPVDEGCVSGLDPEAPWPPSCWRPYGPDSPFNRPVPRDAPDAPGSRAIVDRLAAFGPPAPIIAGVHESAQDWSKPTYYATADDPVFRVHCTRPWGRCELEGERIRIPDAARPAAAGDGHMTVIDPGGHTEYDFWQVASKPAGGGRLVVAWGGKTSLSGDGRGSEAVAAGYGNLAGLVRAQELEAGRIEHALFMVVECTDGRAVYPAARGNVDGACGDGSAAPPLGARFVLDMTADEIDALQAPDWKKAILHAMARYGLIVGDTGGVPWGIQVESDTTYTSLGRPPLFERFARDAGFRADHWAEIDRDVWIGDLDDGVDWRSRLRVVDVCASRGSC